MTMSRADTDALADGDPARRPTLRIALAMRGGVSMAVWIGGAVAELDVLRRALLEPDTDPVCPDDACPADARAACPRRIARAHRAQIYRQMVHAAGHDHVEFDILAGASAGGLNAILFALAQSYGVATDDIVLRMWKDRGGLWDLLRRPGVGRVPSILRGDDQFLTIAADTLAEIATAGGADGTAQTAVDRLTVELAATVLPDPQEPNLSNQAGFTFMRRPGGLTTRFSTIPGLSDGLLSDERRASVLGRMALAARATSSFPGAFEPASVHSITEDPHNDDGMPGDHVWNMAPVFPYARSATLADDVRRRLGRDRDRFDVVDGGVFDNIPIDRALRAIQRATATEESRRHLIYLDPQPPAATYPTMLPDDVRFDPVGVDWVQVIRASMALRTRTETADDEIMAVQQYNERCASVARRLTSLAEVLDPAVPTDPDSWLPAYLDARIGRDIPAIAELLRNPREHFCVPPFGGADLPDALPDPDAVPAAVTEVYDGFRSDTGSVARDTFISGDVDGLADTAVLLITWIQELGHHASVDLLRSKNILYRCLAMLLYVRHETTYRSILLRDDATMLLACRLEAALESQSRWRIDDELAAAITTAPSGETASDGEFYGLLAQMGARRTDGGTTLLPTIRTVLDSELRCIRAATSSLPDRAGLGIYGVLADIADPSAFHLVRLCLPAGIPTTTASGVTFSTITGDTAGTEVHGIDLMPLRKAAARKQVQQWVRKKVDPAEINATIIDDLVTQTRTLSRADMKLAGTELNRFGGFLSKRWRENDWYWGRLDAATGIVKLLGDLGVPAPQPKDDPRRLILAEGDETCRTGTDPGAESLKRRLATVGGETLPDLPALYRFALVSRILPLVVRGLQPSSRSGGLVSRALRLVALILVRPLVVIACLFADPLRLIGALAVTCAAAALLGAAVTGMAGQRVFLAVIIVIGGLSMVLGRGVRRRWRVVAQHFDAARPQRLDSAIREKRFGVWPQVIADSRRRAARRYWANMVVGLVFVVGGAWMFLRPPWWLAVGSELMVLVVAACGLLAWWLYRRSVTAGRPARPSAGRIAAIVATGVLYVIAAMAATLLAWYPCTSTRALERCAQPLEVVDALPQGGWVQSFLQWGVAQNGHSDRLMLATIVTVVVSATVLALISVWGWTPWYWMAGEAVIVATLALLGLVIVAAIDGLANPLTDLAPVAVWLFGMGVLHQLTKPIHARLLSASGLDLVRERRRLLAEMIEDWRT
ncbi:DUF3376 domain-containing protein [Gordonia aquimaris]|jgi:hypothetical protein|uniref:DUF3376 domain-containing protein n=1 Tax=Gordonia aquimaris TaxID=2984863 RepID=A0A9X3D119_9ACTN|nr:DUF3376 domain-containing protein [Gordonia aquimaris]MCX2963068.1 DUF3376 domain-containing protein [Gordonia aquimaris]